MAGTPGALTTDDVSTQMLYNEMIDSVERHNEMDRNFKSLFCGEPTQKRTAQVRQRGMTFELRGADTNQPDMQHVPRTNITLHDPVDWALNASITHRTWEAGMSSDEIREAHAEALDADNRLLTQVIVQQALTDGGWWDATVAPPRYKMDVHLATHDHYLAANVAGIPLLAHFTNAKQHIIHHGYPADDIVSFINSAQAATIENRAEWGTAPGPMPTPVMARLQEFGFTPSFKAAGIPVYAENWIPQNYMLMVCLTPKPMRWRITDNAATADLIVRTMVANDFDMSIKYCFIEEYVRWTSATIVQRGAGVAYYLAGAAYVNPTGFYA